VTDDPHARVAELEAEVLRLRGMVSRLAARVAAAHDVIARNAERAGRPLPPLPDLTSEEIDG
jgi:hypothetical protein